MKFGNNLPPAIERDERRRPEAQKVLSAYNAMALPAEIEMLLRRHREPGRDLDQKCIQIVRQEYPAL